MKFQIPGSKSFVFNKGDDLSDGMEALSDHICDVHEKLESGQHAQVIVVVSIEKDEPSWVHDDENESCPLNDPETFANPATRGLGCSCGKKGS
jgi:hypothetical protein